MEITVELLARMVAAADKASKTEEDNLRVAHTQALLTCLMAAAGEPAEEFKMVRKELEALVRTRVAELHDIVVRGNAE